MAVTALMASACGGRKPDAAVAAESNSNAVEPAAKLPAANADSLYAFVARQVDMGPRIPGTTGHDACVEYITARLRASGAAIEIQDTLFAPAESSVKPQRVRNITGRYNAGAPRHVMLLAHYDTRPWADQEADSKHRNTPIDGANDGGSGVAVLLEIARLMPQLPDNVEVELLFVDAEDAGKYDIDSSWCIGSQAWQAAFDPLARRVPDYAILLDMVGGRNALFPREYFSDRYAKAVNDRVWNTAQRLGYGNRFPDRQGGALNDDHIHILRAGIPAIDIVESANPDTGSFNPTWHTLDDNLSNIDPATLKIVADVVINAIYN